MAGTEGVDVCRTCAGAILESELICRRCGAVNRENIDRRAVAGRASVLVERLLIETGGPGPDPAAARLRPGVVRAGCWVAAAALLAVVAATVQPIAWFGAAGAGAYAVVLLRRL